MFFFVCSTVSTVLALSSHCRVDTGKIGYVRLKLRIEMASSALVHFASSSAKCPVVFNCVLVGPFTHVVDTSVAYCETLENNDRPHLMYICYMLILQYNIVDKLQYHNKVRLNINR